MREPSYLALHRSGALQERIARAWELLRNCELCPRSCRVDRLAGQYGFCRTGARARVASFHAHFGEEAPLVGAGGSGTIFFSSCNLLCSFCQNYEISHLAEGEEVEPKELAAMMHLMQRGCHNINFVTPTHVVPQILQALTLAIEAGLRLLDGILDIYMPDFKFWDDKWSQRFCGAHDYRHRAMAAIGEMHRQVGDLAVDEAGVAFRGLLVRHLVMPHGVADTEEIMAFIAEEISIDTYINVMAQYHPCGKAREEAIIGRRITREEYLQALQGATKAGLRRLD